MNRQVGIGYSSGLSVYLFGNIVGFHFESHAYM